MLQTPILISFRMARAGFEAQRKPCATCIYRPDAGFDMIGTMTKSDLEKAFAEVRRMKAEVDKMSNDNTLKAELLVAFKQGLRDLNSMLQDPRDDL